VESNDFVAENEVARQALWYGHCPGVIIAYGEHVSVRTVKDQPRGYLLISLSDAHVPGGEASLIRPP
jgi:hypothetical protein